MDPSENEGGAGSDPRASQTADLNLFPTLLDGNDTRPTDLRGFCRGSSSRVLLGSAEDFARLDPSDPELVLLVAEARGALGAGRTAAFLLHVARVFERSAVRAQALERLLSRKGNVS